MVEKRERGRKRENCKRIILSKKPDIIWVISLQSTLAARDFSAPRQDYPLQLQHINSINIRANEVYKIITHRQ